MFINCENMNISPHMPPLYILLTWLSEPSCLQIILNTHSQQRPACWGQLPHTAPHYRVFSKGRNEVGPSKSLIFWTFSDVLDFF